MASSISSGAQRPGTEFRHRQPVMVVSAGGSKPSARMMSATSWSLPKAVTSSRYFHEGRLGMWSRFVDTYAAKPDAQNSICRKAAADASRENKYLSAQSAVNLPTNG